MEGEINTKNPTFNNLVIYLLVELRVEPNILLGGCRWHRGAFASSYFCQMIATGMTDQTDGSSLYPHSN